MTTTTNFLAYKMKIVLYWGGGGGGAEGNKNSVRRSTEGVVGGGSRLGERIRFLKQIVHKYTQVTIPNLLNG